MRRGDGKRRLGEEDVTRFRDEPHDDGEAAVEPETIVVEITDTFDLHDFHPREIPELVDAYLEAAQEKGFIDVRIVHGRGKGVQRARVQSLLNGHTRVESFADAPGDRGGWGATLVKLRPA